MRRAVRFFLTHYNREGILSIFRPMLPLGIQASEFHRPCATNKTKLCVSTGIVSHRALPLNLLLICFTHAGNGDPVTKQYLLFLAQQKYENDFTNGCVCVCINAYIYSFSIFVFIF